MLRPSASTTLPVPGATSFVSATFTSLDMVFPPFREMKCPTISRQLRKDGFVMTLAARLAVMVHKLVAAGKAFQKVLVTDAPLPGQDFRQFQSVVSRLHVVVGLSLLVRLPLLGHDSPSCHFSSGGRFFSDSLERKAAVEDEQPDVGEQQHDETCQATFAQDQVVAP